ncbi:MAG: YdcF family protein [Candidatus Taylorbacteria bacterium]|nr:YdcF family protein [Candidatus Taylorbacteria bacterium]
MFKESKKAIAILGGGIIKGEDGGWRPETNHLWRISATALLWKDDKSLVIIAMGGKGYLKNIPDAPTCSSLMRDGLTAEGVSDGAIIEESQSGTTHEQLQVLPMLISEYGFKNVSILSNDWHFPRIKKMIELDPKLFSLCQSGALKFIFAEEVLVGFDKAKWEVEIEAMRQSEYIRKRIESETQGIMDLNVGRYRFR